MQSSSYQHPIEGCRVPSLLFPMILNQRQRRLFFPLPYEASVPASLRSNRSVRSYSAESLRYTFVIGVDSITIFLLFPHYHQVFCLILNEFFQDRVEATVPNPQSLRTPATISRTIANSRDVSLEEATVPVGSLSRASSVEATVPKPRIPP